MASTPDSGTDQPQPWARPFVAMLLAASVTCGVFGIEAWPLSGFRLSAPRSSLVDWPAALDRLGRPRVAETVPAVR